MTSSLPKQPLLLFIPSLFLLLLLLSSLALGSPTRGGGGRPARLTYHRGSLLSGNVKLTLVWYGPFGRVQKNVIRSFIQSLNYRGLRGAYMEPQVSAWWRIVESYQPRRRGVVTPITVKVVRQITDKNYSVGKVLTVDFIPGLIQKATAGDKGTIAVVFAARGVTVQGLCMGNCSQHGVLGRQPYILVGDPETECPGTCAWPFYPSDYGPKGVTLQPPSGNVGADAMVVSFATALAATVTNPYDDGFYGGSLFERTEAGTACPHMFGSGAFPGYTGKVRVDPATGGAFNARGFKGRKFLLPAVWNPITSSCWTPL
ncbi:hypothetical protein BT93_K2484 [Corymbia citriodora subsp. variegata]|nr:hypothetical protein BT93_K2484 [Corymbia citriodora subsp. variegata]